MMTPVEENLFHLAERLHKCVWEIKQMPVTEYFGWITHLNKQAEARDKEARKNKGDMTAMSPSEIVSRLT